MDLTVRESVVLHSKKIEKQLNMDKQDEQDKNREILSIVYIHVEIRKLRLASREVPGTNGCTFSTPCSPTPDSFSETPDVDQ